MRSRSRASSGRGARFLSRSLPHNFTRAKLLLIVFFPPKAFSCPFSWPLFVYNFVRSLMLLADSAFSARGPHKSCTRELFSLYSTSAAHLSSFLWLRRASILKRELETRDEGGKKSRVLIFASLFFTLLCCRHALCSRCANVLLAPKEDRHSRTRTRLHIRGHKTRAFPLTKAITITYNLTCFVLHLLVRHLPHVPLMPTT